MQVSSASIFSGQRLDCLMSSILGKQLGRSDQMSTSLQEQPESPPLQNTLLIFLPHQYFWLPLWTSLRTSCQFPNSIQESGTINLFLQSSLAKSKLSKKPGISTTSLWYFLSCWENSGSEILFLLRYFLMLTWWSSSRQNITRQKLFSGWVEESIVRLKSQTARQLFSRQHFMMVVLSKCVNVARYNSYFRSTGRAFTLLASSRGSMFCSRQGQRARVPSTVTRSRTEQGFRDVPSSVQFQSASSLAVTALSTVISRAAKVTFINNNLLEMLMKDLYTQIASNPELLKMGFQLLTEKLQQEDNRRQTLQIIRDGSYEFTLILVQNVYPEIWATLGDQEKRKTRGILMEAVVGNSGNRKYLQSLAIFVSKVHNVEGYEHWVMLYAELIQKCKPQIVIEYFLVLFRESDNRISVISEYLLPYLYSMLREMEAKMTIHELEKSMILVYHLIKSFSCSEDCDPDLIDRCFSSSFEGWVNIFVNVLQNPTISHLQKYVVKILTNMFADMPKYSAKCMPNIIFPVWMFFNRIIVIYLQENVVKMAKGESVGVTNEDKYIKQIRFEQNSLTQGLVYQVVQLINTLFCNPAFQTLNRVALYLILNNYYNLLLISQADQKEWLRDENKFIADIDDELSLGLRNQVSSCIRDLVERWPEAEPTIRIIIENGLGNASQIQLRQKFENIIKTSGVLPKLLSSGKIFGITMEQLASLLQGCFVGDELIHPWRRKQAAILLLYYNAEQFFEDKSIDKKPILEILSKCIASKEHPLLQIQAMRAITRCSASLPPQAYFDLLNFAVEFLNSPYAGMRTMAVRSIGAFCLKIRNNRNGSNINFSEQQITAIISVAQGLNGETMHIFLQTCVQLSKLNPQTNRQLCAMLSPLALPLLQSFHQEGLLFSLLLQLFSQLPVPALQAHIYTFLSQNHTSQQKSQLVSLCFQLLQKYVERKTWAGPQLLPLIKHVLANQTASSVVKEYLKDGEIDQELKQHLQAKCRSEWVVVARRRGVDVPVGGYVQECVAKVLDTASQYQLEKALVLPLELLYMHTVETATFLHTKGVYEKFVAKWLNYQQLFQGQMLKRVTILTLIKLNDPSLVQPIKQYLIQNRNSLQTGDLNWQDDVQQAIQQMRIDDDDWLDKRMINQEVETSLKQDLPDVASIDLEKLVDTYLNSA